jgi:transposase
VKKLPPLTRPTPINGKRVDVSPPKPPVTVHRARPAAIVKAAADELKKNLEILGQEKAETDKKIAEMAPQIRRMEELQEIISRKGQHLSVEEQTIILEAHFSKGVGPKAIGEILKRPHSTIVRFIQRYTSTAPIAAATMRAGAETLAKRVIKNANVQEALEVLDRVDALPKKDRQKAVETGPRFNIVVALPGSSAAPPPVPALPDIEAK